MKKQIFTLMMIVACGLLQAGIAQTNGDIVDVAGASKDHTIVMSAIKTTGMTETLKSIGPYTVFAPMNAAFDKLPSGALSNLLKPENKAIMHRFINYHIIAGTLDAAAITSGIEKSNGTLILTTISGGKLTATMENGVIKITDELGGSGFVTSADMRASNGVVHGVDIVLMPK
jgi:uncharacterized surface protein with fasciclin (FAS1) repeats